MTLRRDPNCTLCKLHKTAEYVCLLGQGPEPCEVMVIGEAPGKREDDSGKPFVGKSGKLLEELLHAQGFARKDVFITNAVSCRPPGNRTPSKAEIRACSKWLNYQLAMVKPKYVLLLGGTAYQAITGKAGIKKARGKPFEKDGRVFLPTFHPAFALRDPASESVIAADIETFAEIVDFGGIPRERALNYRIVKTNKDVDLMVDALEGTVSFDLETTGLYPWASDFKITTMGFGTASGEFVLPMDGHPTDAVWTVRGIESILDRIEERLDDCEVVTQNGKFDFLCLWVSYGINWSDHHDFDTMLAHYMLDENSRHDLEHLAQLYCGAPNWDIDLPTKQGFNGIEKQALYQAHDLYYTRNLKDILHKKLLKDPDIKLVFDKIMMPCARLFTEIEYDGLYLNLDEFDAAEEYLRGEFNKAEKQLKKFGDINWGSSQQVGKLLFEDLGLDIIERTPKGAPSTSESVIKRLVHPCTDALLKFKAAKQQLSFFIDGWKPFIHKSKLHPSFKLHGTVTGRFSSEHPNAQQIPRDSLIRSLITAPPDWTLVECDLSQIELRIAAELANERTMLQAFANKKDVHWMTCLREISRGGGQKDLIIETSKKLGGPIKYAEAIEKLLEVGGDVAAEINKEWRELRKKAKAVNFGYLFGMWWKKFKIYARDSYGVNVSDKEARESYDFFFNTYNFKPWHKKQRQFAHEFGYVRSLSGRKRRLPRAKDSGDTPERREAERQAINAPVQSFANEINAMSALQIRKEFSRDKVRLCATVHDAILMRVRDPYVKQVTTRLLEIMRRPKLFDDFDIHLKVPIEAEAKIGPWSKGVSLERWRKISGRA